MRALARDVDQVLAGFMRGQFLVCIIQGTFYVIGLSIIGLDFALFVGLLSGMASFIPYVGSILGLTLSMGLAFAQFWPEWTPILAVLGVFLAGQVIEGNFLTPYLVGGSVGLHPVWLIFSLAAFGSLFGFAGLLLAVPAAAAVGVLARYFIARYQGSRLYADDAP
jgi:predicted PurR-regulated permease PerM